MYSKDFKKCAVEFKLDNHNFEEVFKIFKIAQSTLYAWIKEYKEGFPEKPKRTCEKKINKEKLKNTYSEKSEGKRDEFLKKLAEIPEDKRDWIDESGSDEFYCRDFGYSLRGKKIEDTKRGRKFGRTNTIAA